MVDSIPADQHKRMIQINSLRRFSPAEANIILRAVFQPAFGKNRQNTRRNPIQRAVLRQRRTGQKQHCPKNRKKNTKSFHNPLPPRSVICSGISRWRSGIVFFPFALYDGSEEAGVTWCMNYFFIRHFPSEPLQREQNRVQADLRHSIPDKPSRPLWPAKGLLCRPGVCAAAFSLRGDRL